jgi:hypothetical protein
MGFSDLYSPHTYNMAFRCGPQRYRKPPDAQAKPVRQRRHLALASDRSVGVSWKRDAKLIDRSPDSIGDSISFTDTEQRIGCY